MAARWSPITAEAHRALTDSTAYAGPRVTITDQLGPAVWPKVKTVLEKLGAVYVLGTSAFEFDDDQDARALVTAALAAGRVMADANAEGFVPTPAELAADLIAEFAELSAPRGQRLRVLEPSAGTGQFVRAIFAALGPEFCDVTAVEPDARRARQIPADAHVIVDTFEAYAAQARAAGETYPVVVMNPPFAVPGRPTLWAEHLLTAWELLAPGGRLLAIVPASVLDRRRGGLVGAAGDLVAEHGGAVELEREAFAASGIVVATAAVWLDRPMLSMPVPASQPTTPVHAYMFRSYTGNEPAVTVTRPYLTRGAAQVTPVQAWRDSWRGTVRTLRYRADCAACSLPVWAFDDGENDPRGALGNNSAGFSLHPEEFDDSRGLPIALCAMCGNDGEAYTRALDTIARPSWDAAAEALAAVAPVAPPAARPDPWGDIIASLQLNV